jgi:hypothetical protein
MPIRYLTIAAALLLVIGACAKRSSPISVSNEETSPLGETTPPSGETTRTKPNHVNSTDSVPDSDGWFTFTAGELGFSTAFPGKPRAKATPPSQMFSVQDEGKMFAVTISPLADDVKKQLVEASQEDKERVMGAQFDRARDAAIGKARLLSEQKILLDGFFTCEFQFELEDFSVSRQKLYVANNRLYSIDVRGPKEFVTSPDADKFVVSFKLSEMPGQK